MAKNHSSVVYVEPNYTFSGLTAAARDGELYDRAPDLEDYCISLDIVVELSSRHKSVRDMSDENKVIVMSYNDSSGGKGTVRFMSGTRIGGYEKDNNGTYTPKLKGSNVLTSYYADMHITDLVDYGTTEMLGIKSVDVEYNSTCVPVITVRFTDVRGMSLFQPSELNDDTSFNGIRGFSKGNIAQSFFHAFFTLPLPKFTVILKGFYGEPVSYQVMCDKFDTAFDSKNGYFDVTARFIGYAYSFMSDVSFNALLAAPYSDYEGEKYWDSQVKASRFILFDRNNNPTKMPKLYEIRRDFETLMNESDSQSHDSTSEAEEKKHDIEIQELSKLRDMYRTWYDSLYNICVQKYGKDFCYRFGGDNDEDYRRVVIFTNGENIKGNDLSDEFAQFDQSFRDMTGQLHAAINEYNNSGNVYRKLDNIKDGFKYPRVKTFRNIWYNDKKNLLVFDGFHSDNVLPKKETIDTIFGETTTSQQNALKKFYNDGKKQYIDAFVIDPDYTDIKRRIKKLNELAAKQSDDKTKKRKELNRHMYERMGWYPSVENFTKIVMAHLETLMHIMYCVVDDAEGRTVADLAVSVGEDGVVDVNNNDNVAPFPRLTKLINDDDGYSKSEDAWAGDFKDGIGFVEVDAINGLLNGASRIYELEREIEAAKNNINSESQPIDETAVSALEMPITSYDFLIKKDPYGGDKDVIENINAFAGKVCLRMFGILSLNFFRSEFSDNWLSNAETLGKIEAHNFHKLHKITNVKLMEAIGENGTIKNGEEILKIVTGQGGSDDLPWAGKNGGNVLFSPGDKMWLTRYVSGQGDKSRGIHPIQDISFKNLEETFGIIGANKIPFKDENIVLFDTADNIKEFFNSFLTKPMDSDVYSPTIFNTVKFTKRYKDIWDILSNAEANGIEEYKTFVNDIKGVIKPELNGINFILNGSKSFNNSVNDNLLLPENGDNSIAIEVCENADAAMYAGTGDESEEYHFDGVSYAGEMTEGSFPSYTLTECFGYKIEGGKYKIDKTKSLFLTKEFVSGKVEAHGVLDAQNMRAAQFVMGFDCIDYETINKCFENNAYIYIPNLAALQIGAVIAIYYSDFGLTEKIAPDTHVSKYVVIPEGFHHIVPAINKMSPYCKMGFARYFKDWAWGKYSNIRELYVTAGSGKIYSRGAHYEKALKPSADSSAYNCRLLFRQSSEIVKFFTSELMSLICIVKMSINATEGNGQSDDGMRNKFSIDSTQAKVYLDGFISELRKINGLSDDSESGDPTRIAKDASQVNDDIKIELYRYLKQLYDKWVAATDMKTWLFHKFFYGNNKSNPLGNNFFFIDSFYNKIGDKLLINPQKVSKALKLSISSMDTNVMMYNFLAQVYGEHRCMMKCVQNFKLLSEGINTIFTPVPYNRMAKPDPMPDFVVIYTYESSRNLNVANSEYKDDGFMLNDEFDTPLPIKSRGDDSKFYKIPAFGVSYGRQYQNYFKSVKVDMAHPVMTEQAIIAKHNILAASRDKTAKGVTAQDLYDIYSNQSYTCVVEMMGCAYIQPLMYFVLLNVPFFKGSYLISKVRHRMSPGDMTTEITGVRMSKYCNKMVEDIFTDEEDEATGGTTYDADERAKKADTSNDCEYKVYPIGEDESSGDESTQLTGDMIRDGVSMIKKLMQQGASAALAAGIAGNMSVESGFNNKALNANDKGYMSGGLCQWRGGNLKALIDGTPSKHGRIPNENASEYKATTGGSSKYNSVQSKLPSIDAQVKYVIDSLKSVDSKGLKWFNEIKNPEEAAKEFRSRYEVSEHPESERWKRANKFFNEYKKDGGVTPSKPTTKSNVNNPIKYTKWFFNAIQKSLNSTEKYAGELEYVDVDGDGTIRISVKDKNREKLAVLFDIILNSEEYYKNMDNLNWVYKDAPTELPTYIEVYPIANASNSERRIYVYKFGDKSTKNKKLNGTDDCNERLMQSLAKKYLSNKDLFIKECPQFSDSKDSIDKYKPEDCDSLYNPGSSSNGGESNDSMRGGVAINEGGMIGNWNAKKAAEWLVCSTRGRTSQHICALAVQQAIVAGGYPCPSGDGYRKALNLAKTKDWDYVASGVTSTAVINFNSSYKPQVGDVIGMVKGPKTNEFGHVCLYCGSEHGWVSDYIQKNEPYPYSSVGAGKYWVVRYKGTGGTTSAKPIRCNSTGKKCLNSGC